MLFGWKGKVVTKHKTLPRFNRIFCDFESAGEVSGVGSGY